MDSGFAHDPHSEQGFSCPRNFFGITDYAQLLPAERTFVMRRAGQLEDKKPIGAFDSAHLRAIHRYLFQDVFPWAGEFRVVNISKGGTRFGPAMFLGQALDETLGKLAGERLLGGLAAEEFAERAAFYLGEINAIHPFREGNGRTQREFIRQLGVRAGYTISWAGFTQQEMVEASIRSHLGGDHGMLTQLVRRAMVSEGTA